MSMRVIVQVKLPYFNNWSQYSGVTHVEAVKRFVEVNSGFMNTIRRDGPHVVWTRTLNSDTIFEHEVDIVQTIKVVPKRGD